jgi:Pyridine nucleotide-disulphide oxidoreductase
MLETSAPTLVEDIDRWLAAFEQALSGGDGDSLAKLFHADSHWRDLVALSWHVSTFSGAAPITQALQRFGALQRPNAFKTNRGRTAPRHVVRAGRESIEAIFQFETQHGRASGLVRLIPDARRVLKAWTLLTALDEIKGFEENVGQRRPRGESFSRDFRGPNWLDQRRAAATYQDRDPTVLIVGGGQAGLAIAARLKQLNVDALVIDREQRIGDNWRTRYHALTLHNQVQVNHFPYMSFPPNWPTYIPKDKLANWFEMYVEAMEINFWTGSNFAGGTYDEGAGRWTVVVEQAKGERTLRPRHIIMATGICGIPREVEIPGLKSFAGKVLHSSQYGAGAEWAGRYALVIGSGNSGHDIAQDLYSNGAQVALVQRSPTSVFSIEPSGQLPYALYNQGDPLEDCDLIAASMSLQPLTVAHKMMTAEAQRIDRPLLDGLARAGFKLDVEDETGWLFKYMNRGGGYYFNVGCSDLIAEGKIPVVQFADIDGFAADGARMKSGEVRRADLVVLATGYFGPESLVKKFFGESVANRVGRIWGYDPESQEVRNAWCRTAQPGLWFMAGSFAQSRIYSKYLAQQIKAVEEGLV